MKIKLIWLFLLLSNLCTSQILIPFLFKNGKYGFVDTNNNIVIKPTYDRAFPFEEHRATANVYKDNMQYLILRNGNALCRTSYTDIYSQEVITKNYNSEKTFDTLQSVSTLENVGTWEIIFYNKENGNILRLDKKNGNDCQTFFRDSKNYSFSFNNNFYKRVISENKQLIYNHHLELLHKDTFAAVEFLSKNMIVCKKSNDAIIFLDSLGSNIFKTEFLKVEQFTNTKILKVTTQNKMVGLVYPKFSNNFLLDTLYTSIVQNNIYPQLIWADNYSKKICVTIKIMPNNSDFKIYPYCNVKLLKNGRYALQKYDSVQIYSSQNGLLFNTKGIFGILKYSKDSIDQEFYVIYKIEKDKKITLILDESLNIKSELKDIDELRQLSDSGINYLTAITNSSTGNRMYSIIDIKGNLIVPYSKFQYSFDKNYIFHNCDSIKILYNIRGNKIFEVTKSGDIEIEHSLDKNLTEPILWIKHDLTSPYVPFNSKKVLLKDKLPSFFNLSMKKYHENYISIQNKKLLSNGMSVDEETLLRLSAKYDSLGNPYWIEDFRDSIIVRDKNFNKIELANGFYIKKIFNSYKIMKGKNDNMMGVLDSNNKWVVKPHITKGFEFINNYLIESKIASDNNALNEKLIFRIHPSLLDSIWIDSYDFIYNYKLYSVKTYASPEPHIISLNNRGDYKILSMTPKEDRFAINLMDTLGKFITNFIIGTSTIINSDLILVKGEKGINGNRNSISIVVDRKGNIIKDFKKLSIRLLTFVNDSLFLASENSKYGVVDRNGNIKIPIIYNRLSVEDNKFLVYKDEMQNRGIIIIKNLKELNLDCPKKSFIKAQNLYDTSYFCVNTYDDSSADTLHFFDSNYNFLSKLDCKISYYFMGCNKRGLPNGFAEVNLPSEQRVYFDFIRNKLYKE